MQDNGYIEVNLTGGQILLLDREDYDRLPYKDNWRIYTSNGKQFVGRWTTEDGKNRTTYLSTLLFEYDRGRQKIVFTNGNRLDYRSANVKFAPRQGNLGQKNLASFFERRDNKTTKIRVNGCILTKAQTGQRCADFLNCSDYTKCLDEVCRKTEWPGWKATCAQQVDPDPKPAPRRKLKLETET